MGQSSTRGVVYVDRDGVINRSPGSGFVTQPSEWTLLPQVVEGLRRLQEEGYTLIVVSNQSAVGLGSMNEEQLSSVTQHMLNVLQQHGVELDDVRYCIHAPDAGCTCRKPAPGLLREALDAEGDGCFWMLGDTQRDIVAGRSAGCQTIVILTGKTLEHEVTTWDEPADAVAGDFSTAVELIIRGLGS